MALDFGKLNFSTSFNPTSAFPLDARSYFESYELAVAAAATAEEVGSSTTTYFYGETLAVYNKDDGTVNLYQITPEKTLKEVGSTVLGDDKSIEIVGGKVSIKGVGTAEEGAQLVISNGQVKWVKPDTTTVEGLSTAVSALQQTVGGADSGLVKDVNDLKTTVQGHGTRLTEAEGDITTLQEQIQGLTGAIHFKGKLDELPESLENYNPGDVVLVGTKEYICYENEGEKSWVELGDEGTHLTLSQAQQHFVPLTRTINGKPLSDNVTLVASDIEGIEASGTAQGLIDALDMAEVTVGATKTLASIKQENGVVTATAVDIAIPHTAVTDWDTELAKKQDAIVAEGEGFLKKTADGWEVDSNEYLGLHAKADTAATADKVANKLIIGTKEFNGSAEITVTAADLNALTAVPQATTEAIGGIKLGHAETATERAVVLDGEGKAYVSIPAAVAYTAGAGLALTGTEFKIKEQGVEDSMIKNVNVSKLEQTPGDILILNGGNAD